MTLNIRKVNKDQLPKTNVPGRTRQPSEFDPYMAEAYADGEWRGVPYDGTEGGLNDLLNELGRAASHAGYGKSTRAGVDDETGEPTMYFLIRDKLPTGRRGKTSEDGTEVEDNVDSDNAEDSPDGVEIGETQNGAEASSITSIDDSNTPKRGRSRITRDPVTSEAGGW